MPSGQRNARLWGLTQLRNATMSNVTEAMTRRATAVNAVAGSTRQRKVRGCFDWVGLWIGAEGGSRGLLAIAVVDIYLYRRRVRTTGDGERKKGKETREKKSIVRSRREWDD